MITGWDSRQLHTLFYAENITQDRFLHIHFLHFADNSQRPNKGEEYDRLWQLRTFVDKLNEPYTKFYKHSQHLGEENLSQNSSTGLSSGSKTSKKTKCFRNKIYKLCDESRYTYDMTVYLGTESHSATDDIIATHATVRHFTCDLKA